jgi:hypothetical protein
MSAGFFSWASKDPAHAAINTKMEKGRTSSGFITRVEHCAFGRAERASREDFMARLKACPSTGESEA